MKKLTAIYFGLFKTLLTGCKKDIILLEINHRNENAASKGTTATGVVFYVSPTGNDDNYGISTATPWQNISKVNTQTFLPGEQILFEGGKIINRNLFVNSSGNSNAYI